MKRIFRLSLCLPILGLCVLGVPAVKAVDTSALRDRMEKRLAGIDEYKERGAFGENSRGYLEARADLSSDAQQLLRTENEDRAAVYGGIAQQTGMNSEQVGRARAKQIASRSKPGVWLQSDDGKWYKK